MLIKPQNTAVFLCKKKASTEWLAKGFFEGISCPINLLFSLACPPAIAVIGELFFRQNQRLHIRKHGIPFLLIYFHQAKETQHKCPFGSQKGQSCPLAFFGG
ncbi:Uncharacterised protein [Serratia quinivorans]|nr:Uncharacterised protein [Serratia quinivorans]